jgi:hypothetical protein
MLVDLHEFNDAPLRGWRYTRARYDRSGMTAFVPRLAPARLPRTAWFALGAAFAFAAALAAPSTVLLPAPGAVGSKLLAAAALFAVFAAGFLRPLPGLFSLVTLAVLEGAIRKWIVNDIDVFLLKDFLCVGIYAAVLPRIPRQDWTRPWWLLVPLLGTIALALAETVRSPTISEAVVGLRSYVIYVPLLWVGPVLLRPASQALRLLYLTLVLGIGEAIFSVVQALSQSTALNKLVSGAQPALITLNGIAYLRPSGTFMQSGTLAVFVFMALLVSFSFVALRRGRLYAAGMIAPVFLTWGLVYVAARSLFGATLIALVVLLGVLGMQRRFGSLLLVVASFVVGYVLLFTLVPKIDDAIRSIGGWKPQSATSTASFLGRSADLNKAGGKVGLWSSRVKPQLDLIKAQRFGHGTGTMTLGSEYASSSAHLQGESQYSKLAWELGLPGFVLYVWFVVAFAVYALLGFLRARADDRVLSAVGFGIAALAPVWAILTFAPDYPIMGIFMYLFGGYAVWIAGALEVRGPERAHAADDRSPSSLPASAGMS